MHLYHFAMKGFWVKYFETFLSFSPNQRPVTYYIFCTLKDDANLIISSLWGLLLFFPFFVFTRVTNKIQIQIYNLFGEGYSIWSFTLFNSLLKLEPDTPKIHKVRGTIKKANRNFQGYQLFKLIE